MSKPDSVNSGYSTMAGTAPGGSAGELDLGRGYGIALLSAAVFSLNAIFIRYLTETFELPALVLSFWREFLLAVFLGAVLGLWRPSLLRVGRKHLGYLFAYGLALAAFNAVWTITVDLTGAAVGTVMGYTSAAFTALLGWWLLHESMSGAKVAAVGLTLGGCALISGAPGSSAWHANLPGVLAGLLSGLGYSAYSLMGRRAAQKRINPWTALFYTFAFASVWMLGANLLGGRVLPGAAAMPQEMFWLGRSAAGWGALLTLAAGPTLVGYGLYNVSLNYLASSTANLIATVEPAFTAVVAWFVLGERFTLQQVLGAGLIGAGVVWLRLHERRHADPAADAEPTER